MTTSNHDIEPLIIDIQRAELMASDENIDADVRDTTLSQFVLRTSGPLIELLTELKELRSQADQSGSIRPNQKTHRVIIEGFSDESAEAALSTALDKAAHYFTEDHDISISIQQLINLPEGGHRATLEVRITPLKERHSPHVKNADIELKRDHEKSYRESFQKLDDQTQHLIFDHFSKITHAKSMGKIPSTLLININDAKILHYMLEKQFLKAEMAWKNARNSQPTPDAPEQILVRFNHTPDLEN